MLRIVSRALRALLAVCVFTIAPASALGAPGSRATGAGQPVSIGDAFVGEELQYDIGAWFFNRVAEGRIVLKEESPGVYVATFTAKANGVIDSLLRHRRDRYVARLRLSDDGRRFLTESFEKEVTMDGKGTRRSLHHVDYKTRTVRWRSWGADKPENKGELRIPDGIYTDDPIAAFYNFRYGVYGDITGGKDYRIMTFPKDEKFPEIFIRIARGEELSERNRHDVEAGYLADAKVDKDLFGSKSGDIEIFFTSEMLPVVAVAKGIIFFGDVRGKLREFVAPPRLTAR